MSVTENIRVMDTFPEDYAGEFVVCFGKIRCPSSVARELLHHVPQPTHEDILKAREADPVAISNGLIFLLDPDDGELNLYLVKDIQKEYLRRYFKRVIFPRFSPCTPDPFGIRKVEVVEIVREITRVQNIPYIFRYPLADKLMLQDIKSPVLLLLPGPSLQRIGPRLKELSKSFIIVAISRTLQFCLDHGVEPDFVIQLDTFLVQKHLYQDIPELPNTTLVCLSCTHIRDYAHKFRGIFFVGSFNTMALPRDWRMRENPVSTLMACMGFAECLQSETAVLCGTDLCFGTNAKQQYMSDTQTEGKDELRQGPQHIAMYGDQYVLSDRKGKRVQTLLRYLATSVEAEHFARAIRESVGTRFYSSSDSGILSSELFPKLDVDGHAAQSPTLDRQAMLDKVDTALQQREAFRLAHFMETCVRNVDSLDRNILFLESCKLTGQTEGLDQNMIRMFADKERDYNLPQNPAVRLNFSSKIAKKWRYFTNQAKNLTLAQILAMRGMEIPLACLAHETDALPGRLAKLFPNFRWKIHPIVNFADHSLQSAIGAASINIRFSEMRVAFISAKTQREYDYQFDVYGSDNLVYLSEFLPED